MDTQNPHLIQNLRPTAVTKITCMQNHDHKNFTRKDLWAWMGLRMYVIMLPSSLSRLLIPFDSIRQDFHYVVQEQ